MQPFTLFLAVASFGVLILQACAPVVIEPGLTPPEQALAQPGLTILGGDAAKITVTRLGADGKTDARLTQALQAAYQSRETSPDKKTVQVSLEHKLHQRLERLAGFDALVGMLNPDDDLYPRANANFAIDFARSTTTEVTFLPGKKRRTFFFEIGLVFTLLDAHGRIAYSKDSNYFRMHACVVDNQSPCRDLVTDETIDLPTTWLQAIDTAFEQALAETMAGLRAWAGLLNRLQANVEVNLGDAVIKQLKPAAYARKKALAGHPYLFLQVPRLRVDQLIKDLRARGAQFTKRQRQALAQQLERHLSATLRSGMDQALRELLSRSRNSKQAGIFILPDRDAV